MRMAGRLMTALGGNFAKAFPKATRKQDILYSVLPDAAFGVFSGAMTPGDLGDKLIAGTTDAVLGAGLTGGLRGATGASGAVGTAIELGGGMASGMLAYPISDQLLRLKGGGVSPYDRLQQEQYAAMRQQIEQDVLKQLMSGRRVPVVGDPFMSQNGLG